MAAFCAAVMLATVSTPSSLAPNMSCSIGLAIDITPMPAVTFRHSTPQISQNCGVFQDVVEMNVVARDHSRALARTSAASSRSAANRWATRGIRMRQRP